MLNNPIKIEYMSVADILPYEKNPRKNNKAVDIVVKSMLVSILTEYVI